MKIDVDIHNLLRHIGRLETFFEMRRMQRDGRTTDSPQDMAENDLKAVAGIIQTGIKNIDPCDLNK